MTSSTCVKAKSDYKEGKTQKKTMSISITEYNTSMIIKDTLLIQAEYLNK